MTPVEIMARAAFAAEQAPESIWEEFAQVVHDGYLRKAEVHVDALESAGWVLAHPDQVTLGMCAAAVEQRDVHDANIGQQIAAALAAGVSTCK